MEIFSLLQTGASVERVLCDGESVPFYHDRAARDIVRFSVDLSGEHRITLELHGLRKETRHASRREKR
jgi:hypothetical protein